MLQPAAEDGKAGKTERCHANGERNFLLKSEMRETLGIRDRVIIAHNRYNRTIFKAIKV